MARMRLALGRARALGGAGVALLGVMGGWGVVLGACAVARPPTSVPRPPALPPSATGAIAEDRPARARLLMLRGEASEIADAPQAAAEAYSAAIGLDPQVPRFYLRLAELYRSLRAEREAEVVLREGLRLCRAESATAERVKLLLLLAQIADDRGDVEAARRSLGEATPLLSRAAPDATFRVGMHYVRLRGSRRDTDDAAQAWWHLSAFRRAACASGVAAELKEPCEVAGMQLQRIGDVAPGAPAPAAALEQAPVDTSPPRLPVPSLKLAELRAGEAFTVFGASYFLRSRHHRAEVDGERIAVQGYVVKTNLAEAPACAVHPVGVADPEGCFAEVPTFWLGDQPSSPLSDAIPVLGFASNYAQIHDAIVQWEGGSTEPYVDVFWGQALPRPLPAVGAEVVVTGRYGTTFTKSSVGQLENTTLGILTFEEMTTLELGRAPATLPGLLRR